MKSAPCALALHLLTLCAFINFIYSLTYLLTYYSASIPAPPIERWRIVSSHRLMRNWALYRLLVHRQNGMKYIIDDVYFIRPHDTVVGGLRFYHGFFFLSFFFFVRYPSPLHSFTQISKLFTIDTSDWLPRLMGPFSVFTVFIGVISCFWCGRQN